MFGLQLLQFDIALYYLEKKDKNETNGTNLFRIAISRDDWQIKFSVR